MDCLCRPSVIPSRPAADKSCRRPAELHPRPMQKEDEEKEGEEEEEEEEEDAVQASKFKHEGQEYWKSNNNVVYSLEQEVVGKWNPVTRQIDVLEEEEEEYESESEEEE